MAKLTYSNTPPRVAPIRFQPNTCSGASWPRKARLKIRFAKKIGEKVSALAAAKRASVPWIASRLESGQASATAHDAISAAKAAPSQEAGRRRAAQLAASTSDSTARNTSELL